MLMNSFLNVIAKQVNQCYRDLFLNNQKRVNIKLTSQNHVQDSQLKKDNQQWYKSMNLDYREVTDLKSLYASLKRYFLYPKISNQVLLTQKIGPFGLEEIGFHR